MATSDDGKDAATPLDTERAKLKAAGYTDAEISQILVAKALAGTTQGSPAAAQGAMSNALSSIVAIAGHARILVPSFRQDFANLFDPSVRAPARAGSALALTMKAAVILVLAYAGWQEWQQHIISATEIAQSQARKVHAEECSARMKAFIDNTPVDKLFDENEELSRDCDPSYAARKACDVKFKALIDGVENISVDPAEFQKGIIAKIEKHKTECDITDAQRKYALAKVAEVKEKAKHKLTPEEAKAKKASADAVLSFISKTPKFSELEKKIRDAIADDDLALASDLAKGFGFYVSALKNIGEADDKHDYAEALQASELYLKVVETGFVINKSNQDDERETALVSIAWFSLMTRDFQRALDTSKSAVALRPDELVAKTNQAHALLLLGFTEEAKAIYLRYKGRTVQKKLWETAIHEDFEKLRKQGISNPVMNEIDALFKASSDAPPIASQPKLVPPPPPKAVPPPAPRLALPIDTGSAVSPPKASKYYARTARVRADKLDLWNCDAANNCTVIKTLASCSRLRVQFLDNNYQKPDSGSMGVSVLVGGLANEGYLYGLVDASGVEWDGYAGRCRT